MGPITHPRHSRAGRGVLDDQATTGEGVAAQCLGEFVLGHLAGLLRLQCVTAHVIREASPDRRVSRPTARYHRGGALHAHTAQRMVVQGAVERPVSAQCDENAERMLGEPVDGVGLEVEQGQRPPGLANQEGLGC